MHHSWQKYHQMSAVILHTRLSYMLHSRKKYHRHDTHYLQHLCLWHQQVHWLTNAFPRKLQATFISAWANIKPLQTCMTPSACACMCRSKYAVGISIEIVMEKLSGNGCVCHLRLHSHVEQETCQDAWPFLSSSSTNAEWANRKPHTAMLCITDHANYAW